MPAPIIAKDEVIRRLLKVFRDSGYDGATVSRFSEATGLGKASLYHYFPGGKEQMAATVLGMVSDLIEKNIFSILRSEDIKAKQKIEKMLEQIRTFYDDGKESCLFAVLINGDSRDIFQRQLKLIFSEWISELSAVLISHGVSKAEARHRSEDMLVTIQGALILSKSMKSTEIFERSLKHMGQRLLAK